MNKFILFATLLSLSVAAQAHKLKRTTKPSDEIVKQLSEKGATLAKEDGFASNTYKVIAITPLKAKNSNETATDKILRVIKSTLHKDYPITGDDGGYTLSVMQSPDQVEKAMRDFDDSNYDETSKVLPSILQLAKNAVAKKLFVVVGTGSGNNTMANILAVYSPNSQELTYLIESNFGSDN
jgi:hypothetical protein